MRIIIVEDEKESREGLKRFLSKTYPDIEISAVCITGEEGLKAIRKHRPELVITDIRMPDMDGLKMIKACRNEQLNPQFIILSGYPDFSYAQTAIDLGVAEYVLKPASPSKITESVQRIKNQLRPKISNMLLHPDEYSTEDIYRLMPIKDSNETPTLFMISSNEKLESLHTAVIQEFIAATEKKPESAKKENDLYLYSPLTKKQIDNTVRVILNTARKMSVEANVFIKIVDKRDRNHPVEELLSSLEEMKSYMLLFPPGTVIDEDRIREAKESLRSTAYPLSIEQDLLMKIQENAGEDSYRWIISRFSSYLREQETSPEEVRNYFYRLTLSMLYRIKEMYQISSTLLSNHEFLEKIKKVFTYSEAEELLMGLSTSISDNKQQKSNFSTTVQSMINLIETCYASPLSLDDLSDRLRLSADHLSELFSQEVGITFSKYLLGYRMNQACILLSSTDDKIQQIGKAVGYVDPSYFCRIFKKIVGISPKEYRKIH